MLGKLIKYDMKALNRFLLIIHIGVFVLCLPARFVIQHMMAQPETGILEILYMISILLFWVALPIATTLIVAVRFYKNLYSEEGYLTFTLPVTPGQHLLSKAISGTLWALIDPAVVFGALIYVFWIPEISRNAGALKLAFEAEVLEHSISFEAFMAVLVISVVISAVQSVASIYVCIVLGQLFKNHRVLGAVVIYFAMTMVVQTIMTACIFAYGMIQSDAYTLQQSSGAEQMIGVLLIATGLSIVWTIVSYIVCYILMNKKLNLN